MLLYFTTRFNYYKSGNMFVAEASDLNLPPEDWNSNRVKPPEIIIKLHNPKTHNSKRFYFTEVGHGPENEVYGWYYKSGDGINLVILND